VLNSGRERMLEGEMVFLRTLGEEDCSDDYVGWLNDSEVNKHLETRWFPQNCESIRTFISDVAMSEHSILFGIFRYHDSVHIGNIKVGPINQYHLYADIGYFIGDRSAWGHGYATEAVNLVTQYAFDALGLRKCLAGVYASNIASRRVLEKVGYEREACFRNQLQGSDGWEDLIIYSISPKWLDYKSVDSVLD